MSRHQKTSEEVADLSRCRDMRSMSQHEAIAIRDLRSRLEQ